MFSIRRTEAHPTMFISVVSVFSQHGHEIRIAGGAVRDLVSGKTGMNDIDLATTATPEEMVQMLVLDATEAFWKVPLRHCEHQYDCGKIKRRGRASFICYTRTAQGSRGAPLAWSVLFSPICRCVLSTTREIRANDMVAPTTMQVFVDDPFLAHRGTERQCNRLTAVVIVAT